MPNPVVRLALSHIVCIFRISDAAIISIPHLTFTLIIAAAPYRTQLRVVAEYSVKVSALARVFVPSRRFFVCHARDSL